MSDKKSAILRAAKGLTENYASEELFMPKSGRRLPNRSVIIKRSEIYCISGIFQYGYQCYRISGVLCGTQTE